MVGVYDHLSPSPEGSFLGQEPQPAPPPPRAWTREEKFAAAGLALSAVSLLVSYYWTRSNSQRTNPCAECAGKRT